jgi:AcrR family transcriptional regulator
LHGGADVVAVGPVLDDLTVGDPEPVRLGAGEAPAAGGVSVPTLYSRFPTKADLLRRAIEVALAGDDDPVPVADRPTAQWVQAATDPREMLRRYAVMCGEVAPRAGPIYAVLLVAADTDPGLGELLATFEAQRLTAATRIAEAVEARGGLAEGADLADARDKIWIANAPELYLLAVKRGWPRERYVACVEDALLRVVARRAVQEESSLKMFVRRVP